MKLLANAEQNNVFKRDTPIRWKYRNCGYVHEGPEANENGKFANIQEATMKSGARTGEQTI